MVDDGADYEKRIKSVESGETPLAVFTVDALLANGVSFKTPPGVIVLAIDETQGADAMIAYKSALPDVDALNRPEIKLVLTPNSPSETLARVVRSQLHSPLLPLDSLIKANDAEDVLKQFQAAKPTDPRAFVLWEPYVSMALKNPKAPAHKLVDSSRFEGYIVDVLVANRDFLKRHQDEVTTIVQAYLETARQYEGRMTKLVIDDAKAFKLSLSEADAEAVVKGIWWKNTQENYAHFAVDEAQNLQRLEGMIKNIGGVLRKTGAVSRDPTDGTPDKFFSAETLRQLKASGFNDPRPIRAVASMPPADWANLRKVLTIQVEPIQFAPASPDIPDLMMQELPRIAETMKTWPRYYLQIRGHMQIGNEDDDDIRKGNQDLAQHRAEVVMQWLIDQGKVHKNRLGIKVVHVSETERKAEVSFVLLQSDK